VSFFHVPLLGAVLEGEDGSKGPTWRGQLRNRSKIFQVFRTAEPRSPLARTAVWQRVTGQVHGMLHGFVDGLIFVGVS
jgi:hypothetical protein